VPDHPGARLERWSFDERLDWEELWFWLAAPTRTDFLQCGAELVLDEALEVLLRLPDVVDVPALLRLAGGMD